MRKNEFRKKFSTLADLQAAIQNHRTQQTHLLARIEGRFLGKPIDEQYKPMLLEQLKRHTDTLLEIEKRYPMASSMRHNLKMFLGLHLHDAQKLAAKNLHTIRVVVQNNACLCDDDEIRNDRINVIVESWIIVAVLGIA